MVIIDPTRRISARPFQGKIAMNRFQLLAAKWRREAAWAGWLSAGMGILGVLAVILTAIQNKGRSPSAPDVIGGLATMGMFILGGAYMHLVSRLAELAEACGKTEAAPKVTNPD
jgi:hypothetical protein